MGCATATMAAAVERGRVLITGGAGKLGDLACWRVSSSKGRSSQCSYIVYEEVEVWLYSFCSE